MDSQSIAGKKPHPTTTTSTTVPVVDETIITTTKATKKRGPYKKSSGGEQLPSDLKVTTTTTTVDPQEVTGSHVEETTTTTSIPGSILHLESTPEKEEALEKEATQEVAKLTDAEIIKKYIEENKKMLHNLATEFKKWFNGWFKMNDVTHKTRFKNPNETIQIFITLKFAGLLIARKIEGTEDEEYKITLTTLSRYYVLEKELRKAKKSFEDLTTEFEQVKLLLEKEGKVPDEEEKE